MSFRGSQNAQTVTFLGMNNASSSISHLGVSSIEEFKDIVIYSLRQNQDSLPRLHYWFLTAPPMSSPPLLSLISNCLNLPSETQGRSWKLKPVTYKLEAGNTERPLCPGAPQGPVWFHIHPANCPLTDTPTHTHRVLSGFTSILPTAFQHTHTHTHTHTHISFLKTWYTASVQYLLTSKPTLTCILIS